MDRTNTETFPRNKIEALAMLYIQRQDISQISPCELLDMYDNIYNQIYRHAQEKDDLNANYF